MTVRVEESYHNDRERWALCNKLLNMLRAYKGIPLVPPERNPYKGTNWRYRA
jgi:hypothetical protein